MKITYKFATGGTHTIEVDEDTGQTIKALDRQTHANDKKETRRHYSMDRATEEYGAQYADENSYIGKIFFRHTDLSTLRRAMTELSTEQIALIDSVFFNGRQLKDIASELGVSYQAIQDRLNKILKRLRKHFKD